MPPIKSSRLYRHDFPRFTRGLTIALLTAVIGLFGGCDGAGPFWPWGSPSEVDADAGGADVVVALDLQVGGSDKLGKAFIDLSSNTVTSPILRGPQGGQHIWAMVRYRGDGLWPKKLRVAVTMTIRETGKVVKPGTVTLTQSLKSQSGWFVQKTAIPAFVKCPCQVAGRLLDVEVAVVDLYGRTASAKSQITGTWDGVCSGDPPGSCAAQ